MHVNDDDFLTSGEVGRLLGVSPKTVSRWADKGMIPCVITLGGHRRFRRSVIEEIQEDMFGRPPGLTPGQDTE